MNKLKRLKLVTFALAALLLSACTTAPMGSGSADVPYGTTDRNQAALDSHVHYASGMSNLTAMESA